jgi:hypothetical protein
MTAQKVSKSVLENVSTFLDPKYTVDDAYAVLGMQLDALEALDKPKSFDAWMGVGVDTAKTRSYFIRKAREFLAKWWDKIVENVCAWWKKNRDKAGDKLVAGLTAAIAPGLPPPWNAIAGILALIAAIIIKSGFDAVCKQKASKKP